MIPIFVYCEDRKFYENLIYQDHPDRREWFLCFDTKEPPELVIKRRSSMQPRDILTHRGIPWHSLYNGRACQRFFGAGETDNASAVSWFISCLKGAPFPTPCKYDACDTAWPFMPGREGVFFGLKG